MIEQGVKNIYTSDKYKKYLQFISKFHNYSFNNTILIVSQFPTASLIAGYTSWNKNFKRHVNKGEKAIKILAPYDTFIKETIDKKDENGNYVFDANGNKIQEEIQIKILKFRIVNVFDVSQTSGEPLPELVSDLKGTSDVINILRDSIIEICEIPIEFTSPQQDKTLQEGAKGYYSITDNKIVINNELEDLQIVKTLAHEYVHSLLHKDISIRKTQSQREIEAESLAFILCNHFGIDTSDYSFAYIASYSEMDQSFLKQTLLEIKKEANNIIEKIEPIFERRKDELIKNIVYYSPVEMEKISVDLINDLFKSVSSTPLYDYLKDGDKENYGREYLSTDIKELMNDLKDKYPVQNEMYHKNVFYRNALEESVYLRCYYNILNSNQDRPFIESSIERANYLNLESIAKPILNDNANYMKLSSPHCMDFNIERISENRIAISHYYEQNGDMMADPDVELIVDNDNKILIPMTYQQDNLQIFYDINEHPDMSSSLNGFVKEWLSNIQVNNYRIKEIKTDKFTLKTGKDKYETIYQYCKENDIEHMLNKTPKMTREIR